MARRQRSRKQGRHAKRPPDVDVGILADESLAEQDHSVRDTVCLIQVVSTG